MLALFAVDYFVAQVALRDEDEHENIGGGTPLSQ
jgi:hypothetical protein